MLNRKEIPGLLFEAGKAAIEGCKLKDASEESEQLWEGIRVAYRQGEEAVIVLVERLLKGQAEAIVQLESRIEVLENQASKDSKNSSKPPSGDGFKK